MPLFAVTTPVARARWPAARRGTVAPMSAGAGTDETTGAARASPAGVSLIRWTPEEAPLFAALARAALRARFVHDGGIERMAGVDDAGFRAEVQLQDGEVVLALGFDADRVSLELAPRVVRGHGWREGWTLEIVQGDGPARVLTAGGPAIELAGVEGATVCAYLRVARRALVRVLDGRDETVPLFDVAFHRFTRQSSLVRSPAGSPMPWAEPTAAESAPWWELDLGTSMYLSQIRIELGSVPRDARLVIHGYGFVMPSGAPPPGSELTVTRTVEPSVGTSLTAGGVVARYLRVTAVAPAGQAVSLAVIGAEVLAAALYADTLAATLRRSFGLHVDRPLFVARGDDGRYAPSLTYGAVWTRAMALGRGIAARLEPGLGAARVVLAAMTRNRPEWVMADLAALARGYVVVPIAPEEPDDRLAQIIARARPTCVICEPADADRVARLAADSLRLLVVCDDDAAGPGRIGFDALVAEGTTAAVSPPAMRGEDELYAVLFTSGSTGTPKGAMRTYAGFHAMLQSYPVGHSPQHLSFQPLSHLSERMYLPSVIVHGGTIGFSRGGAHLASELRALAPTTLGSVPRLYEVLYAGHQRRLRAALAADPSAPRAAIEARVLADSRAAFGDRLLAVSVGSAPVGAEVLGFLRRCFADLWVSEGYGSTEVGSIAFDGTVLAGVEVQLRPVVDAPAVVGRAGEPERGELWVRTPHVIAGYLGDPAATDAAIDGEGFFATGDLGEHDLAGRVRVIGRVRNTVKLAQGEFVSAERIETVLASAAVVDQVYVHAASGAAGVAALIVPHPAVLAGLLGEPVPAGDPLATLAAAPGAAAAVLAAVRAHGRSAGLAAYELPRGVWLAPAPLTADDGRLTASGKLARVALAERHGAALAALASGSAATSIDDEAAVADDDLRARVVRAASRVLGRTASPREPLGEAGVDSLAAAEILAALGEELGREVPLAWWFEAASLEDLAVRLGRFGDEHPPAAAAAQVDADLALPVAPRVTDVGAAIGTVLLTGATGFLGAHLVEALRGRGLRVVCLVRSPDSASAAARLAAALAARAIPIAVDGDRVRVVVADLAAPELGLTATARAGLAASVDAIVHAGATVSWLASYPALRAPNVLGTVALLALAARRGLPFHHVSTISTVPVDGDEDSALTLAAAHLGTPYALSKWVAEQHVRRAGAAGLPVAIYRPAMIAGHTRRGVGNPDDFLSRYLAGMLELGRYLDRDDAIVDMTPVDFVAEAIAALLIARPRGGGPYHLANADQSLSHAGLGRALVAAGAPLVPSSYPDFRAALTRAPGSRLAPLASFFPARFGLAMGPWPCARTVAVLAGLGVQRPRIDDALIAIYRAALAR